MKIIVPGKPVSVNAAYRRLPGRCGMFLTEKARAWKELIAFTAKAAWRKPPILIPLSLEIWFFYDRHGRDIDGPIKQLLDALQGVLYINDKQVFDLTVHKRYDKKYPRVEITIPDV